MTIADLSTQPSPATSAEDVLEAAARNRGDHQFNRQAVTVADFLRLVGMAVRDEPFSGRVRALEMRAPSGDPVLASARPVLNWLAEVQRHRVEHSTRLPEPPLRVDGASVPRSLSDSDRAWIQAIDAEAPTDDQVQTLAEMWRDAANASDLRLVGLKLAPRLRQLELEHERATLQHELASASAHTSRPERDRAGLNAVLGALAPLLRDQQHQVIDASVADADMREGLRWDDMQALAEAEKQLRAMWTEADANAARTAQAVQKRLDALAAGAAPKPLIPATSPVSDALERGHARARQILDEQRQGREDFDRLITDPSPAA